MILGSYTKLKVGRRYDNGHVLDKDRNKHPVPIWVMREATFGEWLEYATAELGRPPKDSEMTWWSNRANMYFYRVSVD